MKTILYMATTLNGFIAKHDDSSNFLTREEAASYVATVINAGNLIVGRRTYEILSQQPEFQDFLHAGVRIVVVSHNMFEVVHPKHAVAHSPTEALSLLKDEGEVVIAGGGKLNASFLQENLIDELYIDVEPHLLGEGIPLAKGLARDLSLQLLGTKMITPNEIQLHYRVMKS